MTRALTPEIYEDLQAMSPADRVAFAERVLRALIRVGERHGVTDLAPALDALKDGRAGVAAHYLDLASRSNTIAQDLHFGVGLTLDGAAEGDPAHLSYGAHALLHVAAWEAHEEPFDRRKHDEAALRTLAGRYLWEDVP